MLYDGYLRFPRNFLPSVSQKNVAKNCGMRKTKNLSEQLSNDILEYWSFWKKLQTVSNNPDPYKYSDLFWDESVWGQCLFCDKFSARYFYKNFSVPYINGDTHDW